MYESWYEEYQNIQELIAQDRKEEEKLKLEKQLQLAKQRQESGVDPSSPSSEKSSKKKKSHAKDTVDDSQLPPVQDLRMPRDCTEVSEILVNCCGGRAELDRIIIPHTTTDGLYVLEVSDAVSPDCLCFSNSSISTVLPQEMKDSFAIVTAIKSDTTYRFNIISDGDK